MGNAPSSPNPSGSTPPASAGGINISSQPATTSTSSTAPRSTSQPITASTTNNQSLPAERTVFHSGLTPPISPPSPQPPSTPLLLPHAGHLSPQNPHALSLPQAHDYSKTIVTRLILEAKLAPFYRGLEDFEEDWSLDDIGEKLDELRENDLQEGVSNSVTERMKEEKLGPTAVGSLTKKIGIHKAKDAREKEERAAVYEREKKAYLNAAECPICFLNYPPNINTSRCCQQPICTECFVQIKRGEATITHLESEPACCPFCVETDFGVIYERPPTPTSTQRSVSSSALATSPADGLSSGFSQALSMENEEAELSVGPGMAPKTQETMRRKSVNAKDKQVVTIDEIRPDWEAKLNAVKAAAARRASRKIVMRQVGDRLIPIGYTSSRAPGTADFSMSTGAAAAAAGGGASEGGGGGSRRHRGSSGRERDLEELMIMEAMRLSMIDHEDHQKKMHDDKKKGTNNTDNNNTTGSGTNTPALGEPSSSSSAFRKRAGTDTSGGGKDKSAASKLLSKLGGRSRSGSSANKVSFADNNNTSTSPHSASALANSSSSPSPTPSDSQLNVNTGGIPVPASGSGLTPTSSTLGAAPASMSRGLNASSPAGPITTLEDVTASSPTSSGNGAARAAMPRLSMDMAPMQPEPPRKSVDITRGAA